MRFLLLILTFTFLYPLQFVFASAAIEAQQRAAQQRQQQVIQARQQQIIQQQQEAYRQAALSRQHQMQQQAIGQAVANRAVQQQAYNQALQQKVQQVAQQNQLAAMSAQQQALAQARAQQQAYQQQMMQEGVLMGSGFPAMQQPMMPPGQPMMQQVQSPGYGNLFYTPPVAEVVNITDIWEKMENNSNSWNIMIDMEPKILTVQRMIEHFKAQGVNISKGPSHYVQLIDTMAFQNPDMLDQPFENIMRVIAIIEYDYDNGQSKDALARQIFPDDQQFKANKKRLGF